MRIALLLFLAAVALFWPATGNDFTFYDDDAYVTDNVWVLEGLTTAGLHWALTTFHEANWHPLAWVSHQLDATLYGADPFGHHLTSVLLHGANAALLFLFLLCATGTASRSALVAALFAVHPLHVESVAWVAERKDVLCGFFWMLSLLAYVSYARRPGTRRYLAFVALFALALLAKPMAVTLPFVLLLLDFWPLGRWLPATGPSRPVSALIPAGRLLVEKLPLFALAGLFAAITYAAQHQGGTIGSLEVYPLPVRLGNALTSYAAYLGQTFWPRDLAAIYPHPRALPPLPQLLVSLAVLAAVSLAAALGFRRRPALAVGWLWFLGTLVPVMGIVQAGMLARADRYTYLPLAGVFLALVWPAADAARRRPGRAARVAGAACVAALVPLAAVARSQIATWHDGRTLLEHAIAVTDDNWLAHLTLAVSLEKRGEPAEAERHYEAMRRIKRDFSQAHGGSGSGSAGREASAGGASAGADLPPPAREAFLQGNELLRSGRYRDAAARLDEVLRLAAGHAPAHNNRGMALAGLGDRAGAAAAFREAWRLEPDRPEPCVNLGNVLALQGDAAAAAALFRRAAALQPRSVVARIGLGDAQLALGDRYGALFAYREALRIDPRNAAARRRLESARADGEAGPAAGAPRPEGSLDYLLIP